MSTVGTTNTRLSVQFVTGQYFNDANKKITESNLQANVWLRITNSTVWQ
jgi:hypothetical protein